jgi:sterol desaturase/sphingolipid hydroxylase (fatty acid hydroxylase superfamily)
MQSIPYWAWLATISAFFVVLERAMPWRRQRFFRPHIASDLVYVVFSGHVLGLMLAPLAGRLTPHVDRLLGSSVGTGHIAGLPIWAQFLIAFFVVDFIQWCIHNVLHRVSWLWAFHKVHHSILDMDWLGSMRFHWFEVVFYRALQYVPLAMLGFHGSVLFYLALFSTFMGHFNHSNLSVPLGPLRYLLNHPTMHIWHHDHTMHYTAGCNFGINLSLWDWIFRTAYMPEDRDQPERLGFEGVERFPATFIGGQLVPFSHAFAPPEPPDR